MNRSGNAFKPCHPLGLYPVVDSLDWVAKLLALGVKSIQLRIKGQPKTLREEVIKSIELSKKYSATLFINDHWALAIDSGAEGIHLGQSDLDTADIEAIRQAGLLLGVSTHCQEEVTRAVSLQPSYLACGPIYPTTSKIMPYAPQGIEQLAYWQRSLDYPLVAIGGITIERLPGVIATGVSGFALISAITKALNPARATRTLLAIVESRSQHA